MPIRMSRFLWSILPLLLLPLSTVSGQNTATPRPAPIPSEPEASAKVQSRTVLGGAGRQITLDVQVTDKSGRPIRGLQERDFTILDDKQPQKIVSFHAVDVAAPTPSDPPVETILVIDAVNASFRALAFERDAVKKFLVRNGGMLARPMSLVIFTDAGTSFSGYSRDGNALAQALDKYEIGLRSPTRFQDGITGASDRIDISLKALYSVMAQEKTQPGRKLVIWTGPWVAVALAHASTQL